jgi:hypothetical protein
MDDEMIDLMAGDARMRRRLEAYADLRLSPDLATSSRIRARVLAVAHRQSDLARADAALTIVTAATPPSKPAVRGGQRWSRALIGLLAASLILGATTGSAFAARPGGPLYESRLWLETLTLPSNPSKRALAELDRLQHRLDEATDAVRSGDTEAVAAALAAYERIVEQATAAAIAAQDDVAAAVLETGVGHNVGILRALIWALPDQTADAIERAVQHAIERSGRAIDKIQLGQPGSGPNANPGGDPDARPTPPPTPRPTPKPTKKPAEEPPAVGPDGGQPSSTGEPVKPDKPPKPSPQHGPN